jgi:hypothetical protein
VKISFKKSWPIFFSFYVDTLLRRSPLKTSLHNQQMFLEKWEDSDFEEKLLGQIKWPKARLGNLLGSSCIKRRIRRIAMRTIT